MPGNPSSKIFKELPENPEKGLANKIGHPRDPTSSEHPCPLQLAGVPRAFSYASR